MKQITLFILILIASSSFGQWNSPALKRQNTWQNQFQQAQFDNPDLAAQYEMEITKDPALNRVPYERRFKAMQETQRLLNLNKNAISNVKWVERGPKNVSGRTRAIMFDPNYNTNKKVWAAGITGGLWYNLDVENNGVWTNVDDFWENIAISVLVYDPNAPSIFYAGTGEGWTQHSVRGAGIWISKDAGEHWERLASTNNSDFYNTQKIVITSSSRVIASTNQGLFYSDDNGDTWTKVLDGFFGDIELSSNGTIYTSKGCRNVNGTVYRSTDNGDTWEDLEITTDPTERTELASAPTNPDIVYAVSSVSRDVSWFKKSIDGGDTWTDIEIPMYLNQSCSASGDDFTRGQAWYDLIMRVSPENEDIVYVGGIDWHKTTDGGTLWTPVSYWTGACEDWVHADQHALEFFPDDNTKALVGCDGGVVLIHNMIEDFESVTHLNNAYNVTQFYGCAMENTIGSNYMLAGAQDNGTQKFTQSGFNITSEATGGDGGFCFIDQDDSQIQFTSYVYNNWRVSDNGGESFYYYPSTENGSFINPADYDSEADVLYASSTPDTIFVSDIHNDGASGHYLKIENGLEGGIISTVKVSSYSENVIFVGTNEGNIFRISDAISNPTSTSLDLSEDLPNGRISSIDLGENENKILLTYSNYGVESVWQTLDGGNNWTNIEYNLPDMPIRWCLYNPNNTNQILLATETGVWSINDISTETNWEPSSVGLANVRCDQLKYRTSDKMVAVATYGRGLFTSDIFADPQPIALFETDKTISCTNDTVKFYDISTKEPTAWLWEFTPNTISFLNGTDKNSQNPIVQFQEIGQYTVKLTASNNDGSGEITKNNYIDIQDDCQYIMSNNTIYTCEGLFFDDGYNDDYSNSKDYLMTFYSNSSDPNSTLTFKFTMFDVEFEDNCAYDYLNIYDGPDQNSPLIGKYCSYSPETITATNNVLTFFFHSDEGSVGNGWVANISCVSSTNIQKQTANNIQIYPNPAHHFIDVDIDQITSPYTIEIFDLMGKSIYTSRSNNSHSTIDISDITQGIYILKINSKDINYQKKIIIE